MTDIGGKGSSMRLKDIPEEPSGLKMTPLGNQYQEYKETIEKLSWNPADKSEGRVLMGVRRHALEKLHARSLNSAGRTKLFLVKNGENVIGFVAMEIDRDKRLGTITDIWLSERHQSGEMYSEVLHSAEIHLLRHEHCDHGEVIAPAPLAPLRRTGQHRVESNFFTFNDGEGDDSEPPVILEKAA
jgi:hypothetical protein